MRNKVSWDEWEEFGGRVNWNDLDMIRYGWRIGYGTGWKKIYKYKLLYIIVLLLLIMVIYKPSNQLIFHLSSLCLFKFTFSIILINN
jgi:hypothetical protein